MGQTSSVGRLVDHGSATLFAGAVGYSVWLLGWPVAAVAAAVIVFAGTLGVMRRMDDAATLSMPEFTPCEVEFEEDELLLTDLAELLLTETLSPSDDMLLLEDRLVRPESNSRVIRLFDPQTLPSPGDLNDRIEHHIGRPSRAYPDATTELHEALAALKKALR